MSLGHPEQAGLDIFVPSVSCRDGAGISSSAFSEEVEMLGLLYRIVELACRPFDAKFCELANATDEPVHEPWERTPRLRKSA